MSYLDSSLILNGTTLRVKDPKVSIEFYKVHFGFQLLKSTNHSGFDIYSIAIDNKALNNTSTARQGVIHLRHTPGDEKNDNFKANNGNGEHRGFGHICISVDNIVASEAKLLKDGVTFQKKLSDGRQKDIAFALDPDGYWIELIENKINKVEGTTDQSNNRFNHSMIRVKDPKASLAFYVDVLGFKLLSKRSFEDAKFTLYFLAYDNNPDFKEENSTEQATREGILELTHNWGTESEANFKGYHDGNSTENGATPGFSHITVGVADALKFTKGIDSAYKANWLVKYNQNSEFPGSAFIYDPDHYTVQIVTK